MPPVTDESPRLNVSIIVPVRNEEASIRTVIDQLLRQECPPLQIILADGGSTDGTRSIIREYIHRGEPLLLVEDHDAYPGRARNLAIAQAKTEWVAMTDAGTVIPPGWLAGLVRVAADHPDLAAVFGSYEPILASFFQECLALAFVPPATTVDGRPYRGPTTASLLIRRDVWESLGRFPEHLRACEDLVFFERLAASSRPVALAPLACVRWNIPRDFAATFRRFRLYSRHTLRAGMGRSWQLAVGRMYLGGAALVALALFHHGAWLAPLLLAVGWRIHRSIRTRRPWLNLTRPVGPGTYLLVGVLLLWIDLAAFVGCLDYLFGIGRRPRAAASSAP
jgi:glycosyltransferase involved in cell wall biosynthesis